MKPAQELKNWNSQLWYEMLQWKDSNPKQFAIVADGKSAMHELSAAQLVAVAMIVVNKAINHENVKRQGH